MVVWGWGIKTEPLKAVSGVVGVVKLSHLKQREGDGESKTESLKAVGGGGGGG